MKARADVLKEEALNELNSSELSINSTVAFGEPSAFVMKDNKVHFVSLDEVEEGSYLLPPHRASESSRTMRKAFKRGFLARFSEFYSPETAMFTSGVLVFSFLLFGKIVGTTVESENFLTTALTGCFGSLIMANLTWTFIAAHYRDRHNWSEKLIASGVLEVPSLVRTDGSAYEVGVPSHESLYEAVLRIGKAKPIARDLGRISESIEKLNARVKSPRVQKELDKLNSEREELNKQLDALEDEIQTLLAGD